MRGRRALRLVITGEEGGFACIIPIFAFRILVSLWMRRDGLCEDDYVITILYSKTNPCR